MTEVIRYWCTTSYGDPVMEPDKTGEWVKFEDYEHLRAALSEIEDFARGEGDVGNIVARKAAAALRPETAPPAHQPTGNP